MRSYNQHPEGLLFAVINFSIFYILCLLIINGRQVNAQSMLIKGESNSLKSLQQKVQQIYTSQVDIREKQPNSGPAVEQYLRYVNLPKGNPWCAAFVCWVFGEAGVSNPRTGWSPSLFPAGKVIWNRESRTKSQESRLPQGVSYTYAPSLGTNNERPIIPSTGDIFGIYFPEKGRIAHVGFIDRWDGTWLVTVEGNTNTSGSREGDGVYRKRRLVRSIYKVARYIKQ